MYQLPEFQIALKTKVKNSELYKITGPNDIADVCRKCFSEDNIDWYESFVVIAMNKANKVLGFYKVSQGGVSATVCDPKIIMQFALLSNASAIVLCHNHPSGSTIASSQDLAVTERIQGACKLMEISLIDHIILTSESYLSFKEEGHL